MEKYRIKKLGINKNNPLGVYSTFGDSQDYFEGYSYGPPTVGERFDLFEKILDDLLKSIISTSPILEIQGDKIITTYSVYEIKKI